MGAVGSLTEKFDVGALCTPSRSVSGVFANAYLCEKLDEIKAFDVDLIEMETSSFYKMAELLEVPAIVLLIVSDNSATG